MLLTCPPPSPSITENRWANDTDGFVLTAQPGRSQGRPPKTRAQSPSRKKRPAQPAFPKEPLSRSTETTAEPGQQPFKRQFHGPKGESAGRRSWRRSLGERAATRGAGLREHGLSSVAGHG